MITKEYLDKYEKNKKNYTYEIKKLISDIQKEYKKETVDSVVGSSKLYPFISRHMKIVGIDESKIKRLEKRKRYFERRLEKINKELQYKIDNGTFTTVPASGISTAGVIS